VRCQGGIFWEIGKMKRLVLYLLMAAFLWLGALRPCGIYRYIKVFETAIDPHLAMATRLPFPLTALLTAVVSGPSYRHWE
jgi:hypothetical protein